jgi:hypothetical protein
MTIGLSLFLFFFFCFFYLSCLFAGKCMACDRSVDNLQLHASARGSSRHGVMPSSLSSIAPAGGLVGANTRRLIAATQPTTLFHSNSPRHNIANTNTVAPISSSGVNLTPRPPSNQQSVPISAPSGARTVPITGKGSARQPQPDIPLESTSAYVTNNSDISSEVASGTEKKAARKRVKSDARTVTAVDQQTFDGTSTTNAASIPSASPSPPIHPTSLTSVAAVVDAIKASAPTPREEKTTE